MGYRWYDHHGETPSFPFGHGLSYTTFAYSAVSVAARTVTVTVTNNGNVPGAEVAQLYLRFPDAAGEPFRQLKGFQKVFLHPGESAQVKFALEDRWLSTWNATSHNWQLARGTHQVVRMQPSIAVRLVVWFSVFVDGTHALLSDEHAVCAEFSLR